MPIYLGGDEIRIGDLVAYAGYSGQVLFVVDTRSYSAVYPEDQWSYLGQGFMIEVETLGLIHLDDPDEDLVFKHRA